MKTIEPLNPNDLQSSTNSEPIESEEAPVLDTMPDPISFAPGEKTAVPSTPNTSETAKSPLIEQAADSLIKSEANETLPISKGRAPRCIAAGIFGFITTGLIYIIFGFNSSVVMGSYSPAASLFALIYCGVPVIIFYSILLRLLKSQRALQQAIIVTMYAELTVLAVLCIKSFDHSWIDNVAAIPAGQHHPPSMITLFTGIAAIFGALIFIISSYVAERSWPWRIPRLVPALGGLTILVALTFWLSDTSAKSYADYIKQIGSTKSQQESDKPSSDISQAPFSLYLPSNTLGFKLSCSVLSKDGSKLTLHYDNGSSCYTPRQVISISEYKRPIDFNPPYCGHTSPNTGAAEKSCRLIRKTSSGNSIYYGSETSVYWGDFGEAVISLRILDQQKVTREDVLAIYSSMTKTPKSSINPNLGNSL
ncbi:MAG TPA: hypothetical protein VGE34_04175 [Candidatus Saccharimonadales bacterium]